MKALWPLLILLTASAACRFADRLGTDPTATPAATAAGPEAIAPGNYKLDFVFEGQTRRVILHFPPDYDGQTELPLLIVLHGGGGGAAQIQAASGMDAAADEYGVVVAYPNGSGRLDERLLTWNAGHCCGYALEQDVNDVGFLRLLIERLLDHYALDPERVYLTGISNGGMMAYRAGAELADILAGIAPIAGTIGGQVEEGSLQIYPDVPGRPVAVIAFHGQQDQRVLYDGGTGPQTREGRVDLSVDSSVSFWVKANGCAALPETGEQAGGNVIVERYIGCDEGVEVGLVTIVDGGHAWPGGRRGSIVGDEPTQDISANEMMLEFFSDLPGKSQ